MEGRHVCEAFTESVTLQTVFCQAGQDPEQVAFRDALLRQRTYEITEDDYQLLSKRFWSNIPAEECTLFNNALHLLPTKATVQEFNEHALDLLGKPVVRCMAKHNCSEARKASEDDADGLETEVLLAEGASIMITRNLWTSKGIIL